MPRTIGEWKRIPDFDTRATSLSVKNEMRRNLLRSLSLDSMAVTLERN